MSDTPDTDSAKPIPAPFVARLFAFAFCPALLAFAAYLGWQISADASLAGVGAALYARLMVIGLILGVFAACLAVAAHGFGAYTAELKAAVQEGSLVKRIRYQEELLRLITDNIPNVLFIADADGRFWFANRETAELGRTAPADLVGKPLNRLFQPRQAQLLNERIRRAHNASAPVITVDRTDDATGPQYMQTYHIPLPDTADMRRLVMVTQKNITDVIIERERQEETFRQLVDTLVAVVDRRDPYAAGHSIRVGQLAEALGYQMGLDDQNAEACRIAGSLMNIGKIQVPRSILVKTSALNTEELEMVRKAILASADILSLISFQVPVIPVLRQVLERYDGGGIPEKRKGENILMPARVIAVANAFVAMVSPRAHRAGLSIEEAVTNLKNQSGKSFDPRVVSALETYLQNNPGVRKAYATPPPELQAVVEDRNAVVND